MDGSIVMVWKELWWVSLNTSSRYYSHLPSSFRQISLSFPAFMMTSSSSPALTGRSLLAHFLLVSVEMMVTWYSTFTSPSYWHRLTVNYQNSLCDHKWHFIFIRKFAWISLLPIDSVYNHIFYECKDKLSLSMLKITFFYPRIPISTKIKHVNWALMRWWSLLNSQIGDNSTLINTVLFCKSNNQLWKQKSCINFFSDLWILFKIRSKKRKNN